MASTGRALSRLSRAFVRAHVARGAAPGAAFGVPGARPLAWTLTRFESSNAAARARKLEDEQVRAAGAALDAIKPGGETARSGLGDGTAPFPAGTLERTADLSGFGANANDANTTDTEKTTFYPKSAAKGANEKSTNVPDAIIEPASSCDYYGSD